jgi:16S rRNA (cytidine1402-2'-O)-methyltransferase
MSEQGTLYLVATPIGNLEDMTFRAIRVLKEVDLIAAEDTRQTRKLLTHYDIHNRCVSYHEHNKRASGPELIRMLEQGQSIALVSDAGTPAISDPGYELVVAAVEAGITIVPVPGANAAIATLIVSGLSTEQFSFIGFLPREKKKRKLELDRWQSQQCTLLFYESPHRIKETLAHILELWGNRDVCLGRELTKRHEEIWRGSLYDALLRLEQDGALGEFVVAIAGNTEDTTTIDPQTAWWAELSIEAHYNHYIDAGEDRKQALKRVADDRGENKKTIYNALHVQ